MRGHLIMSKKERIRKGILAKVESRHINLKEAAVQMRVCYRQAKRIWIRYKKHGDEGLSHRNRGNVAVSHGYSAEFKEAVFQRYEERYMGFGATLASEKLEKEGYFVGRETLRKWLLSKGLLQNRRKKRAHRKSRERRARFGELLQIDGSIHSWFGDEHGKQCLLNLVDDATTTTFSLLAAGETTEIVMLVLKNWIEKYGIPQAIYVDLKSVYIAPKNLSVFEEACKCLGIDVIKAYSAQAKGRVERNHAVYQDRFVKELRLNGIKTIEAANRLLKGGFIDELNSKFAKEPRSAQDAHAPLCGIDLEEVLVWKYKRQLQNDWTIAFRGQCYQIIDKKKILSAKQSIDVTVHMDGKISLSVNRGLLKYNIVEKSKKLNKSAAKQIDEARCRLAGQKGKKLSPWGKFNPKWLKGSKRSVVESQSSDNR